MFGIKRTKGQLILEALFAVAVAGIVVGLGAGILYTSFRGNRAASEKYIATDLLEETIDAVKAASFEKWLNFYNPPDNTNMGAQAIGSSNLYYVYQSNTAASKGYSLIDNTPSGGSRWCDNPCTTSVKSTSSTSPRNVWIAGAAKGGVGQVWQWDGENWIDRTGGLPNTTFNSVSSVSLTEAWIAGNGGNLYKYDKSASVLNLVSKSSGTTNNIYSISAPSSTQIWIVGQGGTVIQSSDGFASSGVPGGAGSPPVGTNDLFAVSAFVDAANNNAGIAVVAGAAGTVARYRVATPHWVDESGGGWGAGVIIRSASMVDNSHIWIGGDSGGDARGNVWKWLSTDSGATGTWTRIDGTGKWGSANINQVTAFTSSMVFVSGANGNLWQTIDGGTTWTQVTGGPVSINGVSDRYSTDVWAVGDNGSVWRYAPVKWQVNSTSLSNTNNQFTLNGVSYSRYFYIQNVCRDNTTRNITGITDSGGTKTFADTGGGCSGIAGGNSSHDPSTLKITATVSWANGSVSSSDYISRWINISCWQTDWSGGTVGDPSSTGGANLQACPSTKYNAISHLTASGGNLTLSLQTDLSGTLTSAVFDTAMLPSTTPTSAPANSNRGVAINSIMWLGTLGVSGQNVVRLSVAASNCPNGATNPNDPTPCTVGAGSWVYQGTNCGDPYTGSNYPSTPVPLKCYSNLNNKRYIRYTATLCRVNTCGTTTIAGPTVTDIVINWAP